jgi:DNA-binding NtrC family response regulator
MSYDTSREQLVSALLIGAYDNDRLLVHDLFRKLGWRLFEARGRRGALQCLERNPVQVVVAETDVRKWGWKDVLRDLQRFQKPPKLIVTSRHADEYLWAEALNVGAFDVLPQPLNCDEVERVIACARRHFGFEPMRAGSVATLPAAGAA